MAMMKRLSRYTLALMVPGLCLGLGIVLTGCGMLDGDSQGGDTATVSGAPAASATAEPSELLSVGDKVVVALTLAGDTGPDGIPPHDENIREDGTITLPTVGTVQAAGKTPGDLQKVIFNLYVPQYYTSNLNVTVTAPDRVYYVGGEVKSPNRYLYNQPLTVTKAIQSAGDFTEFASKRKVKLIRKDGTTYTENCIKALEDPTLDLPVFPGDKINVPRHW
jgi:polysaccharide biosynthesis/export protein VpsN